MEDEVGGPLISTHFLDVSPHFLDVSPHFLDVSSHNATLGNGSLVSELSSTSVLKTDTEIVSETGDALKSGILIETSKGLEWLTLTDALTSGVGGLNLCVEDFQNVAAQLLLPQVSISTVVEESSASVTSEKDDNSLSTSTESEQTVQCFSLINPQLESIAEATEHCEESKVEVFQPVIRSKTLNLSLSNRTILKKKIKLLTSPLSESTGTNSDSSVQSAPQIQVKKKGGWPKGRKRKPELANRPPKAPCTGYVYYLNEKRKRPEFSKTPFPEVTKILGNEWSSLSLENKKEYLQRAQLDKKRYREELKIYRNSDTYRSYLKRRRIKSCKTNGTEESDFDGTDEIDDEDNEELYCRACDQWFTTLHNKKEHLYGKQHFQAISQNVNSSFSLDESSLDGASLPSRLGPASSQELPSVPDAMAHFMCSVLEREREMKILQERQKILMVKNKQILKELQELKQAQVKLQKLSCRQKEDQNKLEKVICDLWDVPALFYQKQSKH
uniref:HMG box domain-containing protein n=1 Tax=Cuerna arida TaxID=1464854 RepID=A0A1B6G9S7_9HEMI